MAHALAGISDSISGEAVVDGGGNVWLPYDRAQLRIPTNGWTRLSAMREVRHAGRRPFRWHAPASDTLHILNGMGVTLGDSIIGMNAIAWLKTRHPSLRIHLYRTPHAPRFVERLYELAGHLIEPVTYLPTPLGALPKDVVDLSDFLHWPSFSTVPMVDFFLQGLGVPLALVPASAKANRWLTRLRLPPVPWPWSKSRYVLFCGQASTPLRAVPQEHAVAMVERIWQRYGLPVLGFHPVAHPHYQDISTYSSSLDQFMAWVKGSACLIGTDSSAIHIAAGFDVPAMAVFVSIDPVLRARDYANCRVLDARCELTDGLHESQDPAVLHAVNRIWGALAHRQDMPWPVLA